ncbi:MAG TPA: sodium:solute symporter [Cyclobacteriaceae bacterium]|nr:sodium:solute symporter [Cyclobacteriaceae bacterium]
MNLVDWIVLFGVLGLIVLYGVFKSRGTSSMEGFLVGNRSMPWWTVCLSIMATQASAVTFLSTPGQAYNDGMRFLQFYFGLPMAMVILCITAVPLYRKLKVFTAYEYLESRFDVKVRSLAAFYFLILRGFSVGITVFAPSLILSTILGWKLEITTIMIGSLVMIYTISGGSKAVSLTQRYQLTIIMGGMIVAGAIAFYRTPDLSFGETFSYAGTVGKMNLVNFNFDPNDRYNIWSGLIGGLFLFLSYFGADQSQVGRYLAGSSLTESRLGLIFNGLLKVPMQFIILYIGILVFMFYQFNQPPLVHNKTLYERAVQADQSGVIQNIESKYKETFDLKREQSVNLASAIRADDQPKIDQTTTMINLLSMRQDSLRTQARAHIKETTGEAGNDTDFVFINFVMTQLPHGLIGLLLAVVFSAAMSSTASELNALTSTTTVDIYKRSIVKTADDGHYVTASKWITAGWAVFAMAFAMLASHAENLIQLVNIVGSLFYGTLLGIFLSAFYVKYVKSSAVFFSAIIGEAIVICLWAFTDLAFLFYNFAGCAAVIFFALVIQFFINRFTSKRKLL